MCVAAVVGSGDCVSLCGQDLVVVLHQSVGRKPKVFTDSDIETAASMKPHTRSTAAEALGGEQIAHATSGLGWEVEVIYVRGWLFCCSR